MRLESGRLAVVAEHNRGALPKPVVVFFSTKAQLHVSPQRLDHALDGCNDRIVARVAETAAPSRRLDEFRAGPEVLRHLLH